MEVTLDLAEAFDDNDLAFQPCLSVSLFYISVYAIQVMCCAQS